jgi:aminotransferase
MPSQYYETLAKEYELRRSHMLETLDLTEIPYFKPQGAYYVFCDISDFGFEDDFAFAKHLIENVGVAVVPGGGFLSPSQRERQYVRFCFSRKLETLEAARERLLKGELKA